MAQNIAAWFNDSVYMQNKAKQAGLTVTATRNGFEQAGFTGVDGDFRHFINHGQWEDVSPAATFDPEYYYKSKAANVYGVDVSQVTTVQSQFIKTAIHDAGMNAWSHYQLCGTREGIDASAGFDTSAYMEAKLALVKKDIPDFTLDQLYEAFASAGLSAAAHYEAHGKEEGLQAMSVPGSGNPSTPTDPQDPDTPSTPTDPKDPDTPSTPTDPEDPDTPSTPKPVNTFTATVETDYVTFQDGVVDTFITTSFGTPGTYAVQKLDLSMYEFSAFSYLRVDGYTLWSAVNSNVPAVGTIPGWTKTNISPTSMTFTANDVGPKSKLLAAFSYEGFKDMPDTNGGHASRNLSVVNEGTDTIASTSLL